ncbi:hypothetical protein M8C21_011099, partial [Ambrosia artemisiifolia]
YPFNPPEVIFDSDSFHPNIGVNGNICCLDILEENWTCVYDVTTKPDTCCILNRAVTALWSNQEECRKIVKTVAKEVKKPLLHNSNV